MRTIQSTAGTAILLAAAACCALAQPLSCHRADQPDTVRLNGSAELIGDVVMVCSGGTPTQPGSLVPAYQIVVATNTSLPNRLPAATVGSWTSNETLLFVDDPPPASQVTCVPSPGSDSCPQIAGQPSANVFQGRQLQNNATVFLDVPIDPPGPSATRTIRISNLRASPGDLPVGPLPQVTAGVLIFDGFGNTVPLDAQEAVGAVALPSMTFTLLTLSGQEPALNQPALVVIPSLLPLANPSLADGFLVRFTEGFASAFRRRNVGTSGGDPSFIASQAIPGYPYLTETGFFNDQFPAVNGLNTIGLADTGTRLQVVFNQIPAGVQLWASTRDVAGTTGYSDDAPKALLTTTQDSSGSGEFSAVPAVVSGLALLPASNGSASATWEVVSDDPAAVEDLVFSIVLTAQSGAVSTGTATVTAELAPVRSASSTSAITLPSFLAPVVTSSSSSSTSTVTAVPAFSVVNSIPSESISVALAANGSTSAVAPGSLIVVTALGLMASTPAAQVTVNLVDSQGVQRSCQVTAVAQQQVTCVVDAAMSLGLAVMSVAVNSQPAGTGFLQVTKVAPGIFTADGSGRGVAAGSWQHTTGGIQILMPLATLDAATGMWVAQPVDVTVPGGAFLVLKATGLANLGSSDWVNVQVGSLTVPVVSISADADNPGVQLVQVGPLPVQLQEAGLVNIQLTADAASANPVQVLFDQRQYQQPSRPTRPHGPAARAVAGSQAGKHSPGSRHAVTSRSPGGAKRVVVQDGFCG